MNTPAAKSIGNTPLFKNQRANSILIGYGSRFPTDPDTNNPIIHSNKSLLDNNLLPLITKRGGNLPDRIFINEFKNPEP